jgi:hypothetical protein
LDSTRGIKTDKQWCECDNEERCKSDTKVGTNPDTSDRKTQWVIEWDRNLCEYENAAELKYDEESVLGLNAGVETQFIYHWIAGQPKLILACMKKLARCYWFSCNSCIRIQTKYINDGLQVIWRLFAVLYAKLLKKSQGTLFLSLITKKVCKILSWNFAHIFIIWECW